MNKAHCFLFDGDNVAASYEEPIGLQGVCLELNSGGSNAKDIAMKRKGTVLEEKAS